MDENQNVEALPGENTEDQIIESLEITQQLLVVLGEAWSRNDELEIEIAALKAKIQPAQKVPPKTQAKTKAKPAEGIVIIDDSRIMLVRLRSSIESLGFKVVGTAENGQLGAELVVKLRPQLIVLDHQMPDMNGLDCLKAIRLQNPDVRVILCTGGITEQLSQDYIKLDISAIITKPIQLDRFVEAVRKCMVFDPSKAANELNNLVDSL